MNYVFLSQKSIKCLCIHNNKINNFQMKLFILLTFFAVPVWSTSYKEVGKQDLGIVDTFDNKKYEMSVFSTNGNIVALNPLDDRGYFDATIRKVDSLEDKESLKTLKKDGSGSAKVKALSADGKIAGGWANNQLVNNRAIIWYGNNWKDKKDLGTLKMDNSGNSQVLKLISYSDEVMIIGQADTDFRQNHLFALRIPRSIYDSEPNASSTVNQDLETSEKSSPSSTIPQKNQQGKNAAPPPLAPSQSAVSNLQPHKSSKINKDKGFVKIPPMLDVTNTLSTISKLASDTFSIIAFQRQTLTRLQQGCISTDGYWCWSVNANTSNAITKDIVPSINLGYGLTEKLRGGD